VPEVPETKKSRSRNKSSKPKQASPSQASQPPLVFSSAALPNVKKTASKEKEREREKGTPGYYVLDTNSSGIRKYVYHGPDPPDMTDLNEEDVFHEEA
jgi:hypothetical protein